MGYRSALEAAGFKVKEYKEFGSYQGSWIAIDGNNVVVEGGYGSCSGCDAFQAEFDYGDTEPYEANGLFYKNYGEEITKEEYDSLLKQHQDRLAKFGQSYLEEKTTLDEIIERYTKKAEEEYAWIDDREILDWLVKYKSELK